MRTITMNNHDNDTQQQPADDEQPAGERELQPQVGYVFEATVLPVKRDGE
jgi:hypothetical protein